MRAAGFPTTPEGQVEYEPPGTDDARLEAAAARDGQGGRFPECKRREVRPSPRRGQEVSPLHERQQEEGTVPPPALQQTRPELGAQARLWQEHQRRQQGEPVQQQVWSAPVPIPAPAPHTTWASLPTPSKTAVAANWAVSLRSAPEIGAQVSARHRANIAAAEDVLASAEALEKSRKVAVADAQAAATTAGQRPGGAPAGSGGKGQESPRRGCGRAEAGRHHKASAGGHFRSCRGALGAARHLPFVRGPSATLTSRLGPLSQSPRTQATATGQNKRPEDGAFLQGSVACMVRTPRSIFALDKAMAVINSPQAVLLELPGESLLFVDAAWRLGRADSWEGSRSLEMMAGLVTNLQTTHDRCSMVVVWATPAQDQADRERRARAAGRDNNSGDGDRRGGGGRDRRGGDGGNGGGSGGDHGHRGPSRRSGWVGHSG